MERVKIRTIKCIRRALAPSIWPVKDIEETPDGGFHACQVGGPRLVKGKKAYGNKLDCRRITLSKSFNYPLSPLSLAIQFNPMLCLLSVVTPDSWYFALIFSSILIYLNFKYDEDSQDVIPKIFLS